MNEWKIALCLNDRRQDSIEQHTCNGGNS